MTTAPYSSRLRARRRGRAVGGEEEPILQQALDQFGGRGVLLGGVPGVPAAKVVIIGHSQGGLYARYWSRQSGGFIGTEDETGAEAAE